MELSQALMALSSSRWLLKLRSQLGRQGLLHLSGERSLPRMVRLYSTVLVYSTLHLGLKQSACYCPFICLHYYPKKISVVSSTCTYSPRFRVEKQGLELHQFIHIHGYIHISYALSMLGRAPISSTRSVLGI